MTEINTLITNNPITDPSNRTRVDAVGKIISDRLNSLWDPAWNVFIVKQRSHADAVVYGYAFRNHWMWINGIPVIGDSARIWAYIIWKDYNCQGWRGIYDLISVGPLGFDSNEINAIGASRDRYSNAIIDDPWRFAYRFVTDVSTSIPTKGFSAVVSMDTATEMGGYICLVGRAFRKDDYVESIDLVAYGSLFLFQTR